MATEGNKNNSKNWIDRLIQFFGLIIVPLVIYLAIVITKLQQDVAVINSKLESTALIQENLLIQRRQINAISIRVSVIETKLDEIKKEFE